MPFNRASFPLKTIKYLAAGRAVVSTDLPAARWLGTNRLTVANGPRAFADAVEIRLKEPLIEAVVVERQAFAAAHSWSVRARQPVRRRHWFGRPFMVSTRYVRVVDLLASAA